MAEKNESKGDLEPAMRVIMLTVKGKLMIFLSYGNYVGVRIYQGIRTIKRSELRRLGGATFWNNHLPAVATILTPILVCLKPKNFPIRWRYFL